MLAITIVLDGVAFAVGLVSLRRQAAARRRSLRQEIVRTTDPADATVVLGSGVQLVGGLLAFMALIVRQATGNTTADAVASALIGVLLMLRGGCIAPGEPSAADGSGPRATDHR